MDVNEYALISCARQLMNDDGSYDEAFNMFLYAFERNLRLAPAHENEVQNLLLKLNSTLDESRMDIIFENFKKALRIYPNNADLINNLGIYLYKYGFYNEAQEHFEKVLSINPDHVNAEKNLNSIKNLLVERWHYRMLNDSHRNECYRRAITDSVRAAAAAAAGGAGPDVLDVGTGSGLLALYARGAGARRVLACDGSPVMARLAHTVVRTHDITRVQIVNKMSTELAASDTGGRFSLLVTELFDAALFGEHVLQTLAHARPALLAPGARVLPAAAQLCVVGARSRHLNRNYRLCSEAKELLNIPSVNVHVATDDSYDSEDVHLVGDVEYLTEPESVIKVDFNDHENVTENLERTEPYHVNLKAKEDGVIDTVIGWFDLYLSDSITITTDPTRPDRATAWQNAIFFGASPIGVTKNETIGLKFMMNGGKLTMVSGDDGGIIRVSPETMRFLNDTEYLKLIGACTSMACVYLGQAGGGGVSRARLVDLCPFPAFGLGMLRRGARSLTCCARTEADRAFIVRVCAANGVEPARLTIVCGERWTADVFGDEKYDAIFTHALEAGGDVDTRLLDVGVRLRRRHLARGGLALPARVRLAAQLVSSAWLVRNNRLADDSVRPYRLAALLDAYRVSQNFCADLSALPHAALSAPAPLGRWPDARRRDHAAVRVDAAGRADAILCWYHIELMDHLNEISTNRPDSFMDATLFLTYSERHLVAGEHANIVQLKDSDGCFKLVMEYL